ATTATTAATATMSETMTSKYKSRRDSIKPLSTKQINVVFDFDKDKLLDSIATDFNGHANTAATTNTNTNTNTNTIANANGLYPNHLKHTQNESAAVAVATQDEKKQEDDNNNNNNNDDDDDEQLTQLESVGTPSLHLPQELSPHGADDDHDGDNGDYNDCFLDDNSMRSVLSFHLNDSFVTVYYVVMLLCCYV
ncbi:hypothetical protein RFI_37197, partial [Reticulomyxa filosa]